MVSGPLPELTSNFSVFGGVSVFEILRRGVEEGVGVVEVLVMVLVIVVEIEGSVEAIVFIAIKKGEFN